MKQVKVALGVCAVMCGLIGSVAPAVAHEFTFSKAGTVKGHNTTSVLISGNAGTFECSKGTSEGNVATAGSYKTRTSVVSLSGCVAFGTLVQFSPIEVETSAEGWISILNTVTAKDNSAGCTVTITPTGNKELKSIMFANKSGKLEVSEVIKGMHYSSSGGLCGEGGTNGIISDKSLLEMESGTIEWK